MNRLEDLEFGKLAELYQKVVAAGTLEDTLQEECIQEVDHLCSCQEEVAIAIASIPAETIGNLEVGMLREEAD